MDLRDTHWKEMGWELDDLVCKKGILRRYRATLRYNMIDHIVLGGSLDKNDLSNFCTGLTCMASYFAFLSWLLNSELCLSWLNLSPSQLRRLALLLAARYVGHNGPHVLRGVPDLVM